MTVALRKVLILVCISALCIVSYTFAADYSAFKSKIDVKLNTTPAGADVANDVLNFPVLIRMDPNNFAGFASTKAGGADIRFAKADGTALPYGIERWVDGPDNADTAEIWVLVDTVQGADSTQKFIMYYNNIDAASESATAAVFDTAHGYRHMLHLADNVAKGDTAAKITDGTYYTADGSINRGDSATDSLYSADACIGTGMRFHGNCEIRLPATMPEGADLDYTYSCWFRLRTPGNHQSNLIMSDNWKSRLHIGQGYFDSKVFYHINWTEPPIHYLADGQEQSARANRWHLATLAVNQTSADKYIKLYVDGVLEQQTDFTAGVAQGAGGGYMVGGGHATKFNGFIDQAEIAKVTRSPDWIKLAFESQKDRGARMVKLAEASDVSAKNAAANAIGYGAATLRSRNGVLMLSLPRSLQQAATISIVNAAGKEIARTVMSEKASSTEIDISTLPAGLYLIHLKSKNSTVSMSHVISR